MSEQYPVIQNPAPSPIGDGVGAALAQDVRQVEIENETRARERAWLVLCSFVDNVSDRSEDIETLIENNPKANERDRKLRALVSREIALATNDLLTTIEYSERTESSQKLYVFLGTHWEIVPSQVYRDFVKMAAKKTGLEEMFCEDHEFMGKVFRSLAFRVSKHRITSFPLGEQWVNFQNGTLEIKDDGELGWHEHRAEDFFIYCLPYSYSKRAQCRQWHRFLNQVMPDKDAQTLLAEYIGYCFTTNLKLEKMAVFYGTGCNGKSVVLDMVEKLVGQANVSNVSLSALTLDPEKRSMLENKLVNVSHESDRKLDNAMMKQLVSGEPTDVRLLYHGTHTMYNYAKFFTSFNKLPPSEYTFGFFRRWLLFPFEVTISETEQDPDLTKKLCKELPGIFNWVVNALRGLLVRRSFSKSEKCINALNSYKRSSNSALLFLSESCILGQGRTKLKDLYIAYCNFCNNEGITNRYRKSSFREILKTANVEEFTYQGYNYCELEIKNDEWQ